MEAKALYDFIPSLPDELSFEKGSMVKVLGVREKEMNWYKAEQYGKAGVVPNTYIQIMPQNYFTPITREAIALHDFTASAPDELSFKKGSKLKVLKVTQDIGWYQAEQDGKDGIVPKNYIKLEPVDFLTPTLREAIALHDFTASAPDELSFKKGSKLQILKQDTFLYKVEQNGICGFVPNAYIEVKSHKWYKGHMTRAYSEIVLKQQNKDGQFLVRDSESSPGDFSLSVRFNNQVKHFTISRDINGSYFIWSDKFESINILVNFYRSTSVSRTHTLNLIDMDE